MQIKPKAITKAIRLNPSDDALITEFLNANPFFDFSSLARTAILSFIRQPTISITPISSTAEKQKRRKNLDV
jgi:hypothetical protein